MDLNDSLRACMLGIIIVTVYVLSGIARDSLLVSRIGEHVSHVVTSVFLICFALVLAYLFVRTLKNKYRREGFRKIRRDLPFFGLLWMAMSFVTEIVQQFLAGNPKIHISWTNCNILKGRLTGLFLLVLAIAPYSFGTVMLRRRHRRLRRR